MRYLIAIVLCLSCRQAPRHAALSGELSAGVYDIPTPQATPPARRPYAMMTLTGELGGAGPETVLRFIGDAGGVQDWYGIALGSGAWLHDLTIDTSALTGTVEQTHAVRILGPADGIRIERVTFRHPARGMPGGDCIQIVGYSPDRLVQHVTIADSTMEQCDRSGIAMHSGIRILAVTGDSFADVGDQDIDGEGTGDIDDVTISGVTMTAGPHAQGDLAIQIDTSSHVTIRDATLTGRGVQLYGCDHCAIIDSTITRTVLGSPMPVVDVTKTSTDVMMTGLTVTRAVTAVPGQVMRIAPHNGQSAGVTIAHSTLTQHTAAPAVTAMGVDGLTLDAVTVDGGEVVATGSPTVRADHTAIIGCTLTGGVRISGSYAGFGSLTATDNAGTTGLRCETTSGIVGPIIVARNTWGADSCSVLTQP